jgi:NADH-quinone oxidoreductase subunit N
MNYNQFFNMIPETFLVLSLVLVFLADFCLAKSERKNSLLSKLTAALLLVTACVSSTVEPAEAFGGIYVTSQMVNVMKAILTVGTFIVVVMAQTWLKTIRLEGEFYMLLVSTLLGMYVMTSSGHFLMFFLGLEMASVPMACMVAMDKWKKDSAEAGAKYILTATFSSAIMLYGISFIY